MFVSRPESLIGTRGCANPIKPPELPSPAFLPLLQPLCVPGCVCREVGRRVWGSFMLLKAGNSLIKTVLPHFSLQAFLHFHLHQANLPQPSCPSNPWIFLHPSAAHRLCVEGRTDICVILLFAIYVRNPPSPKPGWGCRFFWSLMQNTGEGGGKCSEIIGLKSNSLRFGHCLGINLPCKVQLQWGTMGRG